MKDEVKSIRTYESDIAETVGKNKESVISIGVKEQTKRQEQGIVLEKKSSNRTLLYFSLFLIVAGVLIIGMFVWYSKQPHAPELKEIVTSIIVSDKEVPSSATDKAGIISALAESAGEKDGITEIKFGAKTTEDLFRVLTSGAPASLIRALGDEYMLGTAHDKVFLIVRVDSFDQAFAGMLEWEKLLPENLGSLFSESSNPTGSFTDTIVRNRDTRSLKDASGKTLLLYSFLDSKTLLFTGSEDAFSELLNAYNSTLLLR